MVTTKQSIARILLPTKREIWIVLVLVLMTFLAFEANLIFLRITQDSIFSNSNLKEDFESQIDVVFSQNKIANIISLVVFWAGVGLVAYSIIWSIYSFFSEAQDEVKVAATYTNQATGHQKLIRSLIQAGILAGIIALGLLTLNVTAPYLVDLWTSGILYIPSEWLLGVGQIAGGFAGMCLNFYLFKILIDWIEVLE
ncbi:hypothetical protein EXS66_02710 [Candidatus Saccharibacteria bacterium]|nr:hypothetical protein [Candidatus Saccharibacteria bacterium]